MKTCVRFRHRQGHPLLVSPQCAGLVTGSGAGRRQTCFCHSRGAHLVYMPIVFTTPLHFYFLPCFLSLKDFNLPVKGIRGVVCNYAQLWSTLQTHTRAYKHQKNKKHCPNSRAKASSSSVLCCTAKLTLGMFVIVLPMKLHSNPFQLPPSLTHPSTLLFLLLLSPLSEKL